MRFRSRLALLSLTAFIIPTLSLMAGEPVAKAAGSAAGMQWQTLADGDSITLTVAAPGGAMFTRTFLAGQTPTFSLRDLAKNEAVDGAYGWELRVTPHISNDVKERLAAARAKDDDATIARIQRENNLGNALTQSGGFRVLNGAIVADAGAEPRPKVTKQSDAAGAPASNATPKLTPVANDQVIADDLIVQGSECIGLDCVSGESFGFDTLRLKENNTRILFMDTSSSAGFATHDWQLTANDSATGGAEKFSIEDITAATVPFTVTGSSPTNSIFVASTGKVGFRTSSPGLDLHISTGDTPAIRQEQTNASGFTAQTWDIGGNEANWFVRDLTGGSRLPFRIRPGAPTSSIDIAASGNVGVGTASPSGKLHVVTTTNGPFIVTTDGKVGLGTATPTDTFQVNSAGVTSIGSVNQLRLVGTGSTTWAGIHMTDNATADGLIGFLSGSTPLLGFSVGSSTPQIVLTSAGNLGVGTTSPTNPIQHSSGAKLTSGGVWTDASSRALKQDIVELTAPEAMAAFRALDPVRYAYKVDPAEHHVGFIAEEVPDLVATKDRKSIAPMDIVAVLTKVVQEQQKTIDELKARLDEMQAPAAH
jgi:hypothetical protein